MAEKRAQSVPVLLFLVLLVFIADVIRNFLGRLDHKVSLVLALDLVDALVGLLDRVGGEEFALVDDVCSCRSRQGDPAEQQGRYQRPCDERVHADGPLWS